MNLSSQALKRRAYHEVKEFFMVALYLWVVLALLIGYKSVVLAEHHIDFASHGFALINALALAKVMHIGKFLRLGDQANDAPLIYPTLLKSAVFAVVLACFKIMEEAAVGVYRGQSFHLSISNLGGGSWKAILFLTLLLFAVLIPFFGFTELQRVLGQGKLGQFFFRKRDLSNPPAR